MDKILEVILVLVMWGTTLAFGGVQPITYSLAEAVLFFALFLMLWKQTRQGQTGLLLPVWPLLFVLWTLVEIVPLPSFLVGSISPARVLTPDFGGLGQGRWMWMTLSTYPHDTMLAGAKILAYFSAFLLAARVFDSRQRKSNLIRLLLLLGLFG